MKEDFTAGKEGGRPGQEAQDGQGHDRFATSGFSHHSHDFPRPDVQAHAVHGPGDASGNTEIGLEMPDAKHGHTLKIERSHPGSVNVVNIETTCINLPFTCQVSHAADRISPKTIYNVGSKTTCRCLSVAISSVNRLDVSEEAPGLKKCFKMS